MKLGIALLGFFTCMMQAHAAQDVQQHTMDNGLNVLLIEAHHVPMLAMKLTMPAGSRFDAQGKGGSASLLATMLMDHSKKSSHQAWSAKLDDAAIYLSAGAGKDVLSLSMTVLREAKDEGMQAMGEALLHPGWRKQRFNILRDNAISGAVKSKEDATTHAADAVVKLLFPKHGYGHIGSGSITSLNAIKIKDLKSLYQRQIRPQGATLAVSGDVTMAELIALLDTYFSTWKGQPEQALATIAMPEPTSDQSVFIKMDKHQALVQWVRLGPSRFDPDYTAALVLNHMLGGGGFGSRLMEEIREKRGLVYGVYSWFQPLQTAGAYTIRLQTRADQAAEAEVVLTQVLSDMAKGNISSEMLQKTKTNLMGGFALRMDSNSERAGLLSMMGMYQRPLDYLQHWTQSIESVTLADVQRVAKRYLHPQGWKRIWVGPLAPEQVNMSMKQG
ncbi:MAG: pitrilysin family protein [Ghiorsea sp.]